ncbi:hypothetical protein GPAL_0450 [Glaciecola pallidula DSM 14239 = ACAM 615]|uniref:Uncharacterized protein n=1 Tax=Brumicola pallidula DSM 14239 = ACAM 615 TaxID=1121922 RepID=K6ZVH0_9ALTE|nr:hypothetical protein GPAL_0450 [Glaciecola pallidula DSM 14239 = ACAM 615]
MLTENLGRVKIKKSFMFFEHHNYYLNDSIICTHLSPLYTFHQTANDY